MCDFKDLKEIFQSQLTFVFLQRAMKVTFLDYKIEKRVQNLDFFTWGMPKTNLPVPPHSLSSPCIYEDAYFSVYMCGLYVYMYAFVCACMHMYSMPLNMQKPEEAITLSNLHLVPWKQGLLLSLELGL